MIITLAGLQLRATIEVAVVAVNPLIAATESQRAQMRFLREMAEQNNETELLRELSRFGPPPFSGSHRSRSR